MIAKAEQQGDKIAITDAKGKVIIRRGYLISVSPNKVSYVNDRLSKTVLVVDDRGNYINSYNVSKPFASGIGW